MFKPGTFQELTIKDKTDFGLYLIDPDAPRERVLLPNRYVTEDMSPGKGIRVFLYLDSEDRIVAATDEPLITLDNVALLRVKQISKIGAFLDWGLPKDLFMPFKEMTRRLDEGDEILVRLYTDKSGRLAASMKKLYPHLSTDSPYEAGDEVTGRIYEFGHDFGTFVAVDDKYSAMLPRHEDMRDKKIGDIIHARVIKVKSDGKLDITTKKNINDQIDSDADTVLEVLDSYAGVLPFTEKADAEVIFRETGLSKNAFKRAVGRLYKKGAVTIDKGTVRKMQA